MKSTNSLRLLLASAAAACLLPGCISLLSKKPEQPPKLTGGETGYYRPAPPAETKPAPPTLSRPTPPVTEPEPPLIQEKPRVKVPTAVPIPGKEGVVFSPFNNKPVDVKGFPSGALVADPTFPLEQKKYFRVP